MSKVKWSIDPNHSEVTFKVKHLMISTVTGHFNKFNLDVVTEGDDFSTASEILFTADIDSINTNSDQRDAHLKSEDFFHAAKHAQLEFAGAKYEVNGENAKLHGNLTIKGVSKPITLGVEFGGIVKDPYGQTKAGFNVTGKISRKDFGLTWNAVTESGGVVVGDEIKVNAEIQLIKQS